MESGDTAAAAKEAFFEALELEGSARSDYLAELGRSTPDVAARVGALLAAHEGSAAVELERIGTRVRGLMESAVGRAGTVVGDYELIEEVASGASGVVWLARQLSLDRPVALKVLRAGRIAGQREVERFRAEAEVVARFHHPNIVPVYEVGEHEGRHYFSMRYYPGGSLATRLGPDERWEGRAAARMVLVLARAVHHAHQRGLLHRDLKPSNVLLDEHGEPAVADFGVAANIDEAGVAAVTRTMAGTPAYMAPEQAGLGGEEGRELTVATDVWALGCILYELLAGRPPFLAETTSGLLAKVRDDAPFPLRALAPNVPRDLETIVLRCLHKSPERRYASANALAIDLARWLEHEPILARRTGPIERFLLAWRRNPIAYSLGFLVVALAVALAVGASWAKVELEQRLRHSYLGEARATRLSGGQGRRARALGLLAEAVTLRPGPELRDEAIACLATSDLTPRIRIPIEFGAVGPAAVDPDADLLAHDGPRGGVTVTRPSDGSELLGIPPRGHLEGLAFGADGTLLAGKYLVAGGPPAARETCVWSVPDGAERLRVPHAWSSKAVDFDPAANHFAFGDDSGRLRAWDVRSAELVLDLDLGSLVGGLDFRGDGGALAVAVEDGEAGRLTVCSFPSGGPERVCELPSFPFVLAWTADDTALLVGCANYNVYRVDVDGPPGTEQARPWLVGHRAEVTGLSISPTEPLVATSSWDRTLRLWDLATGEEVLRIPGTSMGFSRSGATLAYRTAKSIEIADVVRSDALRLLHGHTGKSPAALSFSNDGSQLASFGDDGALLWDLETGRPLGWLTRESTRGVEFSPDGGTLLLSGSRGLERRSTAAPFESGELLLSGGRQQCDLAADGRLLAVRDGRFLELLDPAAPGAVRRYPAYPGFEYLVVGAHARYVAGMSWKGPGISVWRADDGTVVGRLREDRVVLGTALAPDESRVVVGDGIDYEVYALPGLELVGVVPREVAMRESPGTLAFSRDGSLLALGLSEDTLGLYDGKTLERRALLEAAGAALDGRAEFSPDGQRLAISSVSNCVYVWDLGALREGLAGVGIAWW